MIISTATYSTKRADQMKYVGIILVLGALVVGGLLVNAAGEMASSYSNHRLELLDSIN